MAVGERTRNMDEMLTSIANCYEEEFTTVFDCGCRGDDRDHVVGALSGYFFGRRRHPVTAGAKNALESPRQNWRDCSSDISE